MVQYRHHGKGEDGHEPVLPGAIAGLSRTSRHVIDGGGIQRQADGKYDGSGDKGREKLPYLFDGQTHQNGTKAAHNLGSQDGGYAGDLCDGLHAGYIGKAHAEDYGKSGAQVKAFPVSDGKELQEGTQGRDYQGSLDQDYPVSCLKACYAGDNDSGSDASHNHGYHMLESHGKGLGHFRDPVHLKKGCLAGV